MVQAGFPIYPPQEPGLQSQIQTYPAPNRPTWAYLMDPTFCAKVMAPSEPGLQQANVPNLQKRSRNSASGQPKVPTSHGVDFSPFFQGGSVPPKPPARVAKRQVCVLLWLCGCEPFLQTHHHQSMPLKLVFPPTAESYGVSARFAPETGGSSSRKRTVCSAWSSSDFRVPSGSKPRIAGPGF